MKCWTSSSGSTLLCSSTMAGRSGRRIWDHGQSIRASIKIQSRLELENLKRTSSVSCKGLELQLADASGNNSSYYQRRSGLFSPSTGQEFGTLELSSSAPRAFRGGGSGVGTEIDQPSDKGSELRARGLLPPSSPRRSKFLNLACSAARVGISITSSSSCSCERRASTVAGCVRRPELPSRWLHSSREALDLGIVAIAERQEEEQASKNDHHENEGEAGDPEVHSPTPTPTTATEGESLGSLVLDLPKIENPTMDVIQRVCGMRDDREWGPEMANELENANVSFTPFLIQQIVQRMPLKSVDRAWDFFRWAREKQADGKLSLSAHVAMLDALGRAKQFEFMKDAIDLVLEDGYKMSAWPYNSALKWCAQDENVDSALYFWNKMNESNCKATVVTYTRVIDLLARHGHLDESLELFRQMLQADCPPNITTYNVLIQAFGKAGNLEVASSLFSKLSELGCKPNYYTYSTLIGLHLEGGKPEEALEFVKMMRATGMDVRSDVYNAVNKAFPSPNKEVDEAVIRDEGASPGERVQPLSSSNPDMRKQITGPSGGRTMSPSVLIGLLEKGEPLSVEENLEKIKPAMYPRFVVKVLRRMRDPETAMRFFNWAKLQPRYQHNEYCYSMMINILGRSRNIGLLDRIVKDMQEEGVKINTAVFSALITCYGRAKSVEGALNLFAQMKEWGCKPDVVTYTTLIHLLAKHGSHVSAVQMFEEMQGAGIAPNTQTYTVMIYSLVKAGKVSEAVSLLREMPQLGCQPNSITYATIIDRCAKDGHLETAKEMMSQMEEQGITPLRTTITILGSTYRKEGMVDEADRLFEKFRHRRYWDETFKSSTEKVAQELLLSRVS